MKHLFDIVKGKVVMNPTTLWIPEFKAVWDGDESEEHLEAIKIISYIVFMEDYRSPYRDMRPINKEKTIRKDMFSNLAWKPDKTVKDAMKKYALLQETANTRLLKAAKIATDKLTEYFENVDPYDATNIVRNLKELGTVVKSLDTLQRQVEKEQLDMEAAKGSREIGYYENPDR